MLVKYASRCDVLVYEHLTDPEVATPCGERSSEYTEWPTCRNCHDHVCLNHRMQDTFEDDEGRETVLCRDCYWQTVREKDRRAGAKLASAKCTSRVCDEYPHAEIRCNGVYGDLANPPIQCARPRGHWGVCGPKDIAAEAKELLASKRETAAAAKAGSKPAGRCGNYAGHEICSDPLGCSKPSGHEGNCGWDL